MTPKPSGISRARTTRKPERGIHLGHWAYQRPTDGFRDPALGPPDTVRCEVFIADEAGYADTEQLSLLVWVRSVGGVIEIAQLAIEPGHAHAPGGIVTKDLRSIPLHEISRELLRVLRTGEPPSDTGETLPTGEIIPGPLTPPQPPRGWATNLAKRPGRRGKGDLHYALAAAKYVELLDQPKPLLRLAKTLRLEPSQVRSILYEARSRKLLTKPPGKGKPGGTLTTKALDILHLHEQGTER